ncbi:helix-turn-helix transcriptional regulator [Nonomuraea sp. NPDC049141]|uniref:helix-turn-helix domain-containing protein n=1 Tax=unclassified Nonomuraea TaxID=2593643 RepID=UPI0033D054DD
MTEFAQALDELRASRSYTELDKAVRPDKLPSSTLNNLLSGATLPTQETLERYLRACGVPREQRSAWYAARQRIASSAPQGLPDTVRVAHADQRRLGVHAAIKVDGAPGDLPTYVARDVDAGQRPTAGIGVHAPFRKQWRNFRRGRATPLIRRSSRHS